MLTERAAQYEVLNFGRPGAETIDHINYLQEAVLKTKPDYVLLQWFVNDIELVSRQARPVPLRLIPSDTLTSYLHDNSALYYLLNLQWQSIQPYLGLIPKNSYTDYMIKRFADAGGADALEARNQLNRFIRICDTHEIPMGIILFPQLVNDLTDGYPLGFLLDRVLEQCDVKGIVCLDLRHVFARVSPPSKLWVNRFDSHPGVLANELVAGKIVETFKDFWESQRKRRLANM